MDCLIRLPTPPGPIAIDAKFPLEAYEALRAARTPAETLEAQRRMRAAVRAHIRAIAEKYVIEGETAEGALMFLPSEAVYAELHANFGDLVREGFALRVWIVSPTTCMATLTTLRAVLKDARLKAEAHAIRRELGLLGKDLGAAGGAGRQPRPAFRAGGGGPGRGADLDREGQRPGAAAGGHRVRPRGGGDAADPAWARPTRRPARRRRCDRRRQFAAGEVRRRLAR